MKIIFFGTPSFAAAHLKVLVENGVDVAAVVTKPDRPQGRNLHNLPPAVKIEHAALIPNVPLFQPEKCSTPEFVEILRSFEADLFVVVAYGEIIKQQVLDLPRLGCINVHASLLPNHRGAAPIQRSLMHGDRETGISIIKLVLKMDAGDILLTEKISIDPNTTFPELEEALCSLGCKCLLQVINDIATGRGTVLPQDHTLATFADKITPQECQINWELPGLQVHNLIRAVTPHPGAWSYVFVRGQKRRLKILRSEYFPELNQPPKTLVFKAKDDLAVACHKGGIWLKEVQLEGKQVMPIEELLKSISSTEFSLS